MKKIVGFIACCFFVQLASAQAPKWAEKAKKAVFSVVTYDKENKIKGTGNGFYIDAQGSALSDYSLFEGAERAVIINADGKQLDVNRIMGANSMYDVVKFNTPIDKKQITLSIATQPAQVGETVYLLPYSTQKAATVQTGKVTAVLRQEGVTEDGSTSAATVTVSDVRIVNVSDMAVVYITAEGGEVYKGYLEVDESLILIAKGDRITVTYSDSGLERIYMIDKWVFYTE